MLVGGTSTSLPLRLTNHGSAELPLKLSVSAVSLWSNCMFAWLTMKSVCRLNSRVQTTLSQICFSFGEVPKSLLPSSPPSHLSSPHHTLNITLPPKPLNQVCYSTIYCLYSVMSVFYNVSILQCQYSTMSVFNNVSILQCQYSIMSVFYNVSILQCQYSTMSVVL